MTRLTHRHWLGGFALLLIVFVFGLIGAVKPAYAGSISCANVRCASGSCTDTPGGPVCGPTLSCANILCVQGMTCEMQSSGPKCVPVTSDPVPPRHCKWGVKVVNGHYKCRKNPYRKQIKQWKKRNHHYTHHHHAGEYCRHWSHDNRRKWDNRRRWERRPARPDVVIDRPYEPTPLPTPPKEVEQPRYCPHVYMPICGTKPVQCFRAPCPTQTKTFSNSCQMQYTGYQFLHDGECRE